MQIIVRLTVLFAIVFCCEYCSSVNKTSFEMKPPQTNILDSLLANATDLKAVLANKDSYNLQIIYTKIDRDASNKPHFTDYTFNNNGHYFYPASTVKLPASLLALERLNHLKKYGIDKYTTMITDSSYSLKSATDVNSKPTIANYIKEIFLVSDNDAFNRLYEFLGQNYFNSRLQSKDYTSADIRHRLDIFLTEDQNRHTNTVSFYDTAGKLLYQQAQQINTKAYTKRENKAGKGYYRNNKLFDEPFDFSAKNKILLHDLHNMLRAVIFPEAVPQKQRFDLSNDDYRFLYKWMSARPRESKFPHYDSSQYPDAYGKFLMFGAEKENMPQNIRIFNKIGDAYGFLNDVAYIVDLENHVEFMLSATIFCNSDGIFNDEKYDYETVGFPFMKKLGQLVYDFEKQRPRKHAADLSKFVIDYKE